MRIAPDYSEPVGIQPRRSGMDTTDLLDSTLPAQPSPPPAHRRSRVAVSMAALAAITVSVGIAGPHLWTGSAGSSGALPTLAIGLPSTANGGSIDAGKGSASAGSGATGNGAVAPYRLAGSLPTGPDHAAVGRLAAGNVDAALVTRLAGALGLAGEPVKHGSDWTIKAGGAQLTVYAAAGHPWVFARRDAVGCPPLPLDGYSGATSAVGCAVDTPLPVVGGTPDPHPVTPPKPLGHAALVAIAMPVLDATGLDFGAVRADFGTAIADPVVGGLPSQGAATAVSADAAGIRTATGWLLAVVAGDVYPLRSARSVFDELASEPIVRPAIACLPTKDASAPTCPTPEDQQLTVTGAVLGLTMAWEREVPLLVPAWLFTVSATGGTGVPGQMARVAVATKYLAPMDPWTGSGSSGSGSSGSGSSSTDGSPGPGRTAAPDAPTPLGPPSKPTS